MLDHVEVATLVKRRGFMTKICETLFGFGFFKKSAKWVKKDGIIYFAVTSDGTTGPQWFNRLQKKGIYIKSLADEAMRSDNFVVTKGVTSVIAVIREKHFSDVKRTIRNVCLNAERRKLTRPNAEVACLILNKFSASDFEKMGLYQITVVHKEVYTDERTRPYFLRVIRCKDHSLIGSANAVPEALYPYDDGGFAFEVIRMSEK